MGRAVRRWLHLCLCLLCLCLQAHSALIIDEDFDTLDSWDTDLNGVTASVKLVPSSFAGTQKMLSTNVSYCGNDSCYRAEITTPPSMRSSVISGTTGVYWFGFSNYIPADWKWMGQTTKGSSEIVYCFQLHGGDNNGQPPIFGLRNIGDEMTVNVCGNNAYNSLEYSCLYFSLGPPGIGIWTDWVVNVNLQWGEPTGYIKVWRNGQLMVNAKNLLTAYNDIYPPYVKLGSYDVPWKDGYVTYTTWVACIYSRLRVGDSTSSYDDVYTGSGAKCGSYCDIGGDGHTDDILESEFDGSINLIMLTVIPVGCVMLLMCTFYGANSTVERKFEKDPALVGYAQEDVADTEKWRLSIRSSLGRASTGRISEEANLAKRNSLAQSARSSLGAIRDSLIWKEEADFVQQSQFAWEHPWEASLKRKVFWYVFGYLAVAVMFGIAVLLYGDPINDTDGLLPWKPISNWNVAHVMSFMVVSLTVTAIYFLPLLFLPHKLDEGKTFVNDPNFLRRIGVVIPCHKSAGEIGNVVRQVLKYIPPENIVVCDNGNFNWPADNTFEVVKAAHQKVQYVFISQGHKTRALWTGAHRLPPHCKYIMHLDDDTMISDHMVFDEKHFKTDGGEHVSAVAFLRTSRRCNRVTNFTDFWYKITDHFGATQAKIASRAFVPGPAGLWRLDRFIEIFGAHPALPFGEDIFGGFTTLNKGYCIRAETRCMVTTFAPEILMSCGGGGRVQGYGASSLWKQRAHRWTVSALRITGKSLYAFFTYNTRGGILSNIAFRLYRIREYKIIFIQVMYIPFCIIIISRGFIAEFIIVKLLLFLWPFLRNMFINYICWRGQPELQVPFETVLLSPFFNFFLILCAIHGRLKCLLWYLPNVPPNHGMLQMCRPRNLAIVKAKSKKIFQNTLRPLMSVSDQSQDSSTVDSSPTFFLNAANASVVKDGRITESTATDAFEFFYRDGSSIFVSYKDPERVGDYFNPNASGSDSIATAEVIQTMKDAESGQLPVKLKPLTGNELSNSYHNPLLDRASRENREAFSSFADQK